MTNNNIDQLFITAMFEAATRWPTAQLWQSLDDPTWLRAVLPDQSYWYRMWNMSTWKQNPEPKSHAHFRGWINITKTVNALRASAMVLSAGDDCVVHWGGKTFRSSYSIGFATAPLDAQQSTPASDTITASELNQSHIGYTFEFESEGEPKSGTLELINCGANHVLVQFNSPTAGVWGVRLLPQERVTIARATPPKEGGE